MTAALYTRDILRLAASIPHLGRLEAPDGSAEKRAPLCGSRVAVDVVLGAGGRIERIGQEVRACALGQASAALMGRAAVGREPAAIESARQALAAWLAGERDDPGDWPGLGLLGTARTFPARHGAILLPFEAAAEAARKAAAGAVG